MNRRLRRWIADRRALKVALRASFPGCRWRGFVRIVSAERRELERHTARMHEEAALWGTVTLRSAAQWSDPTADPLADMLTVVDAMKRAGRQPGWP